MAKQSRVKSGYTKLENRQRATVREFESHRLRQEKSISMRRIGDMLVSVFVFEDGLILTTHEMEKQKHQRNCAHHLWRR